MTAYVVLKRIGEFGPANHDDQWEVSGPPVESVSAEAAIRKAIDGDKGGTYVAVPLRSWTPVTVTVETKRTLKIA